MQKPGWKTSEFWVTGGINIIALLALFGYFQQSDAPEVTRNFTEIVGGIFALITNATYIWSRTRIKQTSDNN